MSKPLSFGKIDVDIRATLDSSEGVPEPETPFRVVLLGDFSNRAGRSGIEPLTNLRPLLVDRDNFDQVLERLGVEFHLPLGGESQSRTTIRLAALDDFHPDRICERVEAFRLLKDLRRRLDSPATFATAAAEIQVWAKTEPAPVAREAEQEKPAPASEPARPSPENLLEQMLEESSSRESEVMPSRDQADWNAFLREIVTPHLTPQADPQQEELVAQVDAAASSQMRALLHEPTFQALEAAWRAVFFLVDRLETSTQLRLYLLDITKAELAADLNSVDDLRSTSLYRLLVEQSIGTPGGEPWAVLAGNYTFDHSREDVELLGRIAKIASQAGAPFLAAASPHVLGCASLAETSDPDEWQQPSDAQDGQAWDSLRRLPEAAYLGLALPRFLLRLPYGSNTEPIEQFTFEEMPESPSHADYLWGNPAFVCVYLLAEAFSQDGWDLRPGIVQEIEGLPLYVYQQDGESVMTPCAEAWLSERTAERILDEGLMPLLSIRGSNAVRLARFQSLAAPAAPLAGRWSG